MQRVMIVGQPGSGKSTFARALGARTGLPVVHIDLIHWKDGWIERTSEEKAPLIAEVHAREEWIFEGGNSRSYPERLARCDTLIWLDAPVWVRLWRVAWRTWRYLGTNRPDLPEGCPERYDLEFYRFIWRTRNTSRANIAAMFHAAPPEKNPVRLTSFAEMHAYIDAI